MGMLERQLQKLDELRARGGISGREVAIEYLCAVISHDRIDNSRDLSLGLSEAVRLELGQLLNDIRDRNYDWRPVVFGEGMSLEAAKKFSIGLRRIDERLGEE